MNPARFDLPPLVVEHYQVAESLVCLVATILLMRAANPVELDDVCMNLSDITYSTFRDAKLFAFLNGQIGKFSDDLAAEVRRRLASARSRPPASPSALASPSRTSSMASPFVAPSQAPAPILPPAPAPGASPAPAAAASASSPAYGPAPLPRAPAGPAAAAAAAASSLFSAAASFFGGSGGAGGKGGKIKSSSFAGPPPSPRTLLHQPQPQQQPQQQQQQQASLAPSLSNPPPAQLQARTQGVGQGQDAPPVLRHVGSVTLPAPQRLPAASASPAAVAAGAAVAAAAAAAEEEEGEVDGTDELGLALEGTHTSGNSAGASSDHGPSGGTSGSGLGSASYSHSPALAPTAAAEAAALSSSSGAWVWVRRAAAHAVLTVSFTTTVAEKSLIGKTVLKKVAWEVWALPLRVVGAREAVPAPVAPSPRLVGPGPAGTGAGTGAGASTGAGAGTGVGSGSGIGDVGSGSGAGGSFRDFQFVEATPPPSTAAPAVQGQGHAPTQAPTQAQGQAQGQQVMVPAPISAVPGLFYPLLPTRPWGDIVDTSTPPPPAAVSAPASQAPLQQKQPLEEPFLTPQLRALMLIVTEAALAHSDHVPIPPPESTAPMPYSLSTELSIVHSDSLVRNMYTPTLVPAPTPAPAHGYTPSAALGGYLQASPGPGSLAPSPALSPAPAPTSAPAATAAVAAASLHGNGGRGRSGSIGFESAAPAAGAAGGGAAGGGAVGWGSGSHTLTRPTTPLLSTSSSAEPFGMGFGGALGGDALGGRGFRFTPGGAASSASAAAGGLAGSGSAAIAAAGGAGAGGVVSAIGSKLKSILGSDPIPLTGSFGL